MKRKSHRDSERIEFARGQRQTSNEFAQDVWQLVRGRRMLREKFRREHPIGPYTLDFVCLDLMLDLEIDGKDHLTEEGRQRDERRDAYLRGNGFEVLRINGFRVTQDLHAVKQEIESVVRSLRGRILHTQRHSVPPPPAGEPQQHIASPLPAAGEP